MNPDMQDWERKFGVQYLESIGLKPGHIVIDFGAKNGHYSIPAAKIVGKTGAIYAIDTDEKALKMIRNKARIHMLKNIQLEKTSGRLSLEFGKDTIDFVFLYDVLHFLNLQQREKFFSEIKRVLKPEGVLSIFPKHLMDDEPSGEFSEFTLEELMDEIENFEFILLEQRSEIIPHDSQLIEGRILNYMNNF
ncbi:MAG: class I SAM-dependent methyltransferase [Planctomycetes bacterium]|nr:class I SAM-dependent methyltransferase [Planctomycetota bacterium]